jgi:hypothetical protein
VESKHSAPTLNQSSKPRSARLISIEAAQAWQFSCARTSGAAENGSGRPELQKVVARLHVRNQRDVLRMHMGAARARSKLGRIVGRLSEDRPLGLVQIDHTVVDVMVVSSQDRRPLKPMAHSGHRRRNAHGSRLPSRPGSAVRVERSASAGIAIIDVLPSLDEVVASNRA